MIDLHTFNKAIYSQIPFKFALLNNLIPHHHLIALYENAPFNHIPLTTRDAGSDKTYQLYNGLLFDHVTEQITIENLSPAWRQVIAAFNSMDYKKAASQLIQKDMTDCYIQIMLKIYKSGHYISMHTDDSEVAATHLLFMNPFYNFANKGELYFHDANGTKVVSIPPDPAISVLFERQDHSFHSVDKCVSDELPKVSLQIVFWKSKKQRNLSGRLYE